MPTRIALTLLLALIALCPARAQERITVEAPQAVDINAPYFQVKYSVPAAGAQIAAEPDLHAFDLLSPPGISTSSSTIITNGRVQRAASTVVTYTLAPKARGRFTIKGFALNIGGKTLRAPAATLTIGGSGARHDDTQARGGKAQSEEAEQLRRAGSSVTARDLYIAAQPAKKTVWEQEALPVTYSFYERPGVGLNNIGITKKPEFKGMIVQDIPVKNVSPQRTQVGGTTYNSAVVLRYLVFPQAAGQLTLPPHTFDCTVVQRQDALNAMEAFFNGMGNIGVQLQRTTPATTIAVKPLPTPRPAGFSGGVGRFRIHAQLLSPELRTNEPATLRLTVEGAGNLKLLSAPTLAFPADFETYPAKTNDRTQVTPTGVTGAIDFDYTFVPHNIGTYTLPPLPFVYFDLDAQQYRTLTFPAQQLAVVKGTISREEAERAAALRNSDIRSLHGGSHTLAPTPTAQSWWHSPRIAAAYLALLLVFALLIKWGDRLRAPEHAATRRSKGAARTALRALQQCEHAAAQGDAHTACTAIAHTLTDYLASKYALAPTECGHEALPTALARRGVSEALSAECLTLLSDCDMARFAPAGDATLQPGALLQRAQTLINHMEQSETVHANPSHTVMKTLIAALLLATLPTALRAGDLSTADSLYAQGNYTAAEQLYRAEAESGYNAEVQYNLGNTLFRLDRPTEAAVAYRRALWLAPGHSDAAYNLEVLTSRQAVRYGGNEASIMEVMAERILYTHSADAWSWAGWACLALALACLALYRYATRVGLRKVGFTLCLALLLATLLCLAAAAVQGYRLSHNSQALVMQAADFRPNTAKAKAPKQLVEGTCVEVTQDSPEGLTEVALPDGTTGWVRTAALQRVAYTLRAKK